MYVWKSAKYNTMIPCIRKQIRAYLIFAEFVTTSLVGNTKKEIHPPPPKKKIVRTEHTFLEKFCSVRINGPRYVHVVGFFFKFMWLKMTWEWTIISNELLIAFYL